MPSRLLWLLPILFALTTVAGAPEADSDKQDRELVCALIGGSFDSVGDNKFSPLAQKRLDKALTTVGSILGVSVHSVAVPESETQDIEEQVEWLRQMYFNTPPDSLANCLVVGLSVSIADDPESLLNVVESVIQTARSVGITVVAVDYVSGDDIPDAWLAVLSAANTTREEYESRVRTYRDRVEQAGATSVNAWQGYEPLPNDYHPTWQSSLRAAVRILAALI